MKNTKNYYIGLDIGTDSVGYAVTDNRYNLMKHKGEAMWGSHLFDAANQSAERRSFRTAKRRLDRRQQRVVLIDEIFAPEVCKIDQDFYIRKKESALYSEDKTKSDYPFLYFNGDSYDDKRFHEEYPTIHHLLMDLMTNESKKFDIRLINIAVDWLVAHRGHFLSEVSPDRADKVLEFGSIYNNFVNYFESQGFDLPWDSVDVDEFGRILKIKGVNNKKLKFKEFLYAGKIPDDDYFISKKELVTFISGGKVSYSKLFPNSIVEEDISFSISSDMEEILPQLGDDGEVVARLVSMYEWSVLSDILSGSNYISEAKVKVYEQHKKDLSNLKMIVKKYYDSSVYYDVFRYSNKDITNYTAYSYNFKSVKSGESLPKKKCSPEEFCAFLKKTLKLDSLDFKTEDADIINDMIERINDNTFMPKQVNTDNRVIPYQLYYVELKKILENAEKHYPFLTEVDEDGYSNVKKIMDTFTFRIPYYVGPLRKDNSDNAWLVRKAEGKIYPWNFDKLVDRDASENEFINRMTNMCTYIPGKNVLPKNSLLYMKYNVLNEINNLKVNETKISVEAKQGIYNDLFCKRAKVTPKNIVDYLFSNDYMKKDDVVSGIDITIKSSLKSQYEFRNLLNKNILNENDVEKIIERCTYTEDKLRYKHWLKDEYSTLSEDDIKYISRLKYKDFGRLSRFFLDELEGADKETGEIGTIMYFLWESNDNLMQLLSDKYTFREKIDEYRTAYYQEHKKSIVDQMEELGLSNAVKRPVTRTLAVVKDVVSAMGGCPRKIFVEMARGPEEDKGRKLSRKEQILGLYSQVEEDTRELEKQLEDMGDMANNRLQSEALFLYYLQLGKCMYSGESIDVSQLKTTKYNIDHIYPQSLVKDDSVLNNKVLVLSEINGDKKDEYPIRADIRSKMHSYWKKLADNGLITKEKYARLIRSNGFTDEEKMGFINRQLVETRQSMKAVTQLLNNLYPDTEIVYVKAKLASDFKQVFELPPKSRIINDLHHAKDAYLNIVAGNVYHERFTKKFFSVNDKYSLNTKVIFTRELIRGDEIVWSGAEDIDRVKKIYLKNNIHLTRYAFCQKGGLFDQMPLKKGNGQIPLKKGKDIAKYGGYNKATATFFTVARYLRGGKREVSFVPVELMSSERFLNDDKYAIEYVTGFLSNLNSKKIEDVELPLGKRVIKYKSVLSLDGFKVWVNGKANGGKIVLLTSSESLVLSEEFIRYVSKLEKYSEKKKNNKAFCHDSEHDGLSEESNVSLYDALTSKLMTNHFIKMPNNQAETLSVGRDRFIKLSFDEQVETLFKCVELLKSGRTGGVDLKGIGGKSSSGAATIGANLSSCKYISVKIIDESPSGIFTKESINLLELLK